MHPSWQRKILSKLKTIFPNIQFILTTHSPIVLNEADKDYNIFFMSNDENGVKIADTPLLSGYDVNAVLEEFMDTDSINQETSRFIHSIYVDIKNQNYDEAEQKIKQLIELTSELHPDVVMASMELKMRRKNN